MSTSKYSARLPFCVAATVVLCLSQLASANDFHIGPHVQNVTSDGFTVIWETTEPATGRVFYGPEGAQGQEAAAPTVNGKLSRVRISGLQPDVAYAYKIVLGSGREAGAVVKTAPTAQRDVTFVVLGDSRRWERRWEETKMGEHAAQWNPEFYVNMGDLVLDGQKPELWPEHFRRFGGLLASQWMVTVRGNHEGPREGGKGEDLFGAYHEQPQGEPNGWFDWGNTHFVLVADGPNAAGAKWLDEHLASVAGRYKYTIVMSHYPAWCTGYRNPDTARVEDGKDSAEFCRILEKYGVPLYLAGHTHIFERSWPLREGQRAENGVTYLVQGGDTGANYPASWTASVSNPDLVEKPTYTLVQCRENRMDIRTFAWSKARNMIVEIDSVSLCVDPAIPQKQLARLPLLEGVDLSTAILDLGSVGYRPAARNLPEYLVSADAGVRRAAATALRLIASPDDALEVQPHLHNPDLVVRREVARTLEMTMTETQVEQVTKDLLDSTQDVETRVALAGALQMRAPAEAAKKTMRTLLGDDATPEPLRNRAAHAYCLLADKGDVKEMAKLVGRETSLWALQRMAFTLNKLTGTNLSIKADGDLAKSAPGRDRKPFIKQWLKSR